MLILVGLFTQNSVHPGGSADRSCLLELDAVLVLVIVLVGTLIKITVVVVDN
jgi:hypothetical protein